MLTVNQSIFRSYDIRGVYPSEFDETAAYAIGKALVRHTGASTVLLGRDMRLSGESLHREIARGIMDAGADVHDVGLIPVDFIYWAVPKFDYGAGLMVTASHNPSEYNGCKMVGAGGAFIRGVDLRGAIEAVELEDEDNVPDAKGKVVSKDFWDPYLEHVLSFVEAEKLKKMKIVVDAGNGMAGLVIPKLAPFLPALEIIPMSFELDGSFPNRSPNPLAPGALDQLKEKVITEGADCGVAFDSDTDRVFFVDEKGKFIPADMVLLVLAKYWLEKEPGAGIAYNLICSKAIPEIVKEWGGVPLRSAVGYVNIRRAMQEGSGVMGGEVSAHYSFRDNYYADSGYIALLLFIAQYTRSGSTVSHMVHEYVRYVRGDELNIHVEDTRETLALLEAQYSDAKIDRLDGVTFEYKNWWFNARPSNTEPFLRITVEADTQKRMEEKREEIRKLVSGGEG